MHFFFALNDARYNCRNNQDILIKTNGYLLEYKTKRPIMTIQLNVKLKRSICDIPVVFVVSLIMSTADTGLLTF